jgi:putative ABC transport system ATP-binding protein
MTTADTKNIIKVTNLSKSFLVGTQQVKVLKNINFEVKLNDFLIIFGPSGCGKSTLLHTILGLEEPTSGSISFLNQDIYERRQNKSIRQT